MSKILLVNSCSPGIMGKRKDIGGKHHPLGLLYIASVLLENNHEVQICDELVGQVPEEYISSFRPDYLGVSVRTPAFNRAIQIAKAAKSLGIKVILGGPHVSALPEESILASEYVDGVIVNEGEYTFLDLVNNPDWSNVNGLVYKNGSGVIKNPPSEKIIDLNSLPFPARQLLDEKLYTGTPEYGFLVPSNQKFWTICSSRGCPYNCTYCSSSNIFGKKYRFRSAINIFNEILQGYKLGVTNFLFIDDSFGLNREITSELCNLIIENNLNIRWCCQTRVNLPVETIKIMKAAGCSLISFGVESGSDKILENIKKGITKDIIRKGIENAKKAGLLVKAYFIIGLPGEGKKEFKESLNFAKSLDIDYLWLSSIRILPGSELWNEKMQNADYKNINWEDYSYFGKNNDKVLQKRYTWFLISFFLQPKYIVNLIKRMSYREIMYFLALFNVFVREIFHNNYSFINKKAQIS